MRVGEIMTKNVHTVHLDDTLYHVWKVFQKVTFHHMIVTHGKILKGVVSDRDVLKRLSPKLGTKDEAIQDRENLGMRISEIMTKKVVAVKKDISVNSATLLMIHKGVSCLPIATDDGVLEGIVTIRGMLKYYVEYCKKHDDDEQRKKIENELDGLM
ncbi:MAG: CBS domain-containing protein [Fibrobacteria bacterium]|nr:CBS domain-containing protein [Fibrobacteria bacterium]